MTVQELKEKLNQMDNDLIVTICDYENDEDEMFSFKEADGVEIVRSASGKEWVSIFTNW